MNRSAPLRRTQLQRGTTRLRTRTPLARFSTKRRRENRIRRQVLAGHFGTDPLCGACPALADANVGPWRDCQGRADDGHELLSRARGGSITDPANVLPVCRSAHSWITANPVEAERLGLALPSPRTVP